MTIPIFLSFVVVLRNQSSDLPTILSAISDELTRSVADHELIVVDNCSDDDSLASLKRLTAPHGLPNLQIYALSREVDFDTATWVGVENALGDFVAVVDVSTDDLGFLRSMLEVAVAGSDMVFATNTAAMRHGVAYDISMAIFNSLYRAFNGFHLGREAPQFRVVSRSVVNFLLQHPQPVITYRQLPVMGGFARANLNYSSDRKSGPKKRVLNSFDKGMRLLVSNTRGPMRMVTMLTLFGAVGNLVYTIYVITIALFKTDVAPGWITLSLQQSGMFFLISLVLFVLAEYILQMARLSTEGPAYHVGQEFTSADIKRRQRLNIESSEPASDMDRKSESID